MTIHLEHPASPRGLRRTLCGRLGEGGGLGGYTDFSRRWTGVTEVRERATCMTCVRIDRKAYRTWVNPQQGTAS